MTGTTAPPGPNVGQLRDHFLTPLTAILNMTEALLRGQYGELNEQQIEYLQQIQTQALQAFGINRQIVDDYAKDGVASLRDFSSERLAPMSAVISYCDLLLLEYLVGDLNEKQRSLLHRASNKANDLQRQIQNLTDYALITLDALSTGSGDKIALGDILKPDFVTVKSSVPIHWELPDQLPSVCGDEELFDHVMNSLIDNAAKFTRAGYITVTAQIIGDHVDITVTDTGIGIPLTLQVYVFQPFYQLDPKVYGLGLGLFIAQDFVNRMGGRLLMHSTPDVGTQFQFSLVIA
ncbi:MAG: HAMP domain-containing histidine kinase [Anaerolineae bacterium]|nr:HAMP domain-containing histidine kinase [Anaerolineae bacterium]